MNALETYRQNQHLTFEALGDLAGVRPRGSVYRHCKATRIPGDAALLYHAKLGIPLSDLRPDLWPAPPAATAQHQNQPHEAA
jgi:hypothetical protein